MTHLNSADTFPPVRHAMAAHLDLTHLQLVKDAFTDETLQELFF